MSLYVLWPPGRARPQRPRYPRGGLKDFRSHYKIRYLTSSTHDLRVADFKAALTPVLEDVLDDILNDVLNDIGPGPLPPSVSFLLIGWYSRPRTCVRTEAPVSDNFHSARAPKRILATVALIALTTLVSVGARAAVTLSFNPLSFPNGEIPGPQEFGINDQTLVEVMIGGIEPGAPGLRAFQVTFNFDPAQIQLFDPNGGLNDFLPLGDSPICRAIRGGDCPDSTAFFTSTGRAAQGPVTVDDSANGSFSIGYASTGANEGPTGDGALLILGLTRLGDAPTSLDFGADPLTRVTLGTNLAAVEFEPLAIGEVPIPPSIVGLSTALLALGFFARRRRAA